MMLELEEQDLLKHFAYQAWLDRGKPVGSPEVDWEQAKKMLQAHYFRGVEILNAAVDDDVFAKAADAKSKLNDRSKRQDPSRDPANKSY